MTTEDFNDLVSQGKALADVASDLSWEGIDIYSREAILKLAIHEIEEGRLYIARHILDGVDSNYADCYKYDVTMGLLDVVKPIVGFDDLIEYLDD